MRFISSLVSNLLLPQAELGSGRLGCRFVTFPQFSNTKVCAHAFTLAGFATLLFVHFGEISSWDKSQMFEDGIVLVLNKKLLLFKYVVIFLCNYGEDFKRFWLIYSGILRLYAIISCHEPIVCSTFKTLFVKGFQNWIKFYNN